MRLLGLQSRQGDYRRFAGRMDDLRVGRAEQNVVTGCRRTTVVGSGSIDGCKTAVGRMWAFF